MISQRKTLTRGTLIVAEGIDGSGKSTLIQNLTALLEQNGFPVVATREPGATELGKKLRSLLQERDIPISMKAEYLLFAANRAQHFDEIVIPALNQKKLILSDRMADSSIVYQGHGRGLSVDMIKSINTWTMNNHKPDLTIYVRIDLQTATERIAQRKQPKSVFEKEKLFVEKTFAGFEELYKDRDDVLVVDSTIEPQKLARETYDKIITWFTKHTITIS